MIKRFIVEEAGKWAMKYGIDVASKAARSVVWPSISVCPALSHSEAEILSWLVYLDSLLRLRVMSCAQAILDKYIYYNVLTQRVGHISE